MSRVRRSKRLGRLAFFLPVVALIVLIIFGLVSYVSTQSGTLIVEAVSSGRYAPSIQLHAPVTIGASTGTTPANFTLAAGYYTVDYGVLAWYVTPSPRDVSLSGGKTQYAVGYYSPVLRVIGITGGGFNLTAATALHGVTPVIWVNLGGSVVTLDIGHLNRFSLYPSQNFTYVFPSSGTFHFDVFNTNFNGSIQVA